ncbi:hypothetical protein ACHWQZ_G004049 [Mnemiopsis leidyi]
MSAEHDNASPPNPVGVINHVGQQMMNKSESIGDGVPEVEFLVLDEYSWYTAFKALCTTFQEEGHELRIVGDAVRDIIMQIQPKDIDLCTTASPEEMLEILQKRKVNFRKSGSQHGTVTVCKSDALFEINSLRADDMLNGEKISRYGVSFKEDARRRDFTMNAMSLDVEGKLYDYFQGLQHLKEGVLRFTDNALTRVTEDPLRILRYFRFACCSDFFSVACPQDYEEIFAEKRSALADPSIVNPERYWREFCKILPSSKCSDALDQMKECKILRSLGFPVMEKSFKDLIDSCATVKELQPGVKAAVILGIIFKGKVEMLEELNNYWKVSNKVKDVSKFVAGKMPNVKDIEEMKKDLYSYNPSFFEEEKSIRVQALKSDKQCNMTVDQIEELQKFERPTFPFNKDHFAKVLKFKGRQKDATDVLRDAWVESCFTMEIPEMLDIVKNMAEVPEILQDRQQLHGNTKKGKHI